MKKALLIAGITAVTATALTFQLTGFEGAVKETFKGGLGNTATNPIVYLDLYSPHTSKHLTPRISVPPFLARMINPVDVQNQLFTFRFYANVNYDQLPDGY